MRPWWRLPLLLLVCLLAGSGPMRATTEFDDTKYTFIVGRPGSSNGSITPYFEMKMIYYDRTRYANSYWSAAPEIYVDGTLVCTGDEIGQFANKGLWYGDDVKAWRLAEDENGWWGEPDEESNNGVTYRVRFRDPFKAANDIVSCYMRVYISSMEAGSTHKVRIRGYWLHEKAQNNVHTKLVDKEWTFTVPSIWTDTPTCNMTDYNHLNASGQLNANWGPTTVGFYSDNESSAPTASSSYYTKPFVKTSNLKSRKEYAAENSSFSNQSATHNRSDQSQKDGSTAAIEYVIAKADNGFTTNFYKWFNVSVPGFAVPQNLSATTDQWAKSLTLNWKVDVDLQQGGNSRRCKEGKWYIYRGEDQIGTMDYDKEDMSFTDTEVPSYDMNYAYKVAFVPKNTPAGTKINSLTTSITKMVERQWSFSNFAGELVDDDAHIKLTWKHNAISDATGYKSYTLKLYRMEDGGETWGNAIYTSTITSANTTVGTYTDTQELQANHTYIYKLEITLLGKDFSITSEPVTLGGSQLRDFTASRGVYNNLVKLSWTVKQVGDDATSFALARRPLGSVSDKDWANIYTTSGTGSTYGYDDNTAEQGKYYEYRVSIVDNDSSSVILGSIATDGFTYSTGVISGRIKYGTGTAVEGVKVKLMQQTSDGDLTTAGMRSLKFSGQGAGMGYYTDNDEIQQLLGGDFSVQMWVKPLKDEMGKNGQDYLPFNVDSVFSIRLWYNETDNTYQVGGWMGGSEKSSLFIPADKWSHLTFIHSKADSATKVIVATPDEIQKATILNKKAIDWTDSITAQATSIVIGNNGGWDYAFNYRGYMDEVRFFTKALTEKEVERNYNHPLAGNESGLAIYYPFDEGLSKQTIAYDYSKTNGVANGRHGRSGVTAYSSTDVPSEEQLCMMNYTDNLGNYTIRGIHFQGEGTAYSVIPEYNIHEFSPAARSCFVSTSSLVHSGIDFDDVSSFPISGKVVYAGTNYPVEDVYFYVDGTVCAKDGQLITTNESGEFEISVPIGNHFITIERAGHVFVNNGRYPADPNGTGITMTFDREIKGLEFRDTTLVNFTGRVVGGDIQAAKPVGGGLSRNNIGVSELVLTPMRSAVSLNVTKSGETAVAYQNNTVTVPVPSDTIAIASTSWRGAGDDNSNKIFIRTDSLTGEFSALVPPIEYSVSPIRLVGGDQKEVGGATTVDLSNARKEAYDTLYTDVDDYKVYKYHTKLVQAYHAAPTFTVKQNNCNDGEFGISKYTYSDPIGRQEVDIYTIGTDGTVTYHYGDDGNGHGLPLFIQEDPYTFELHGYEQYVNADNGDVDEVPLAGSTVTIGNALSDLQAVYVENGQLTELVSNQLQLDSAGYAFYYWKAGKPNITSPYWRTITMTYDINGKQYDWLTADGVGMKGIVLGDLPTGNNFVTSGPDRLLTILRDPPGTGSSASWEYGTVHTETNSEGTVWSENMESGTTLHFGGSLATFQGIAVGNVTGKIEVLDSDDDQTIYALVQNEGENSTTTSTTTTVTHGVSTSDDPGFVGAQGDVFVGMATNIIFGNARNVGLKKDQDGNLALGVSETFVTGMEFKTAFNYTLSYIENYLFPNFEKMKRSLLRPATLEEVQSFKNNEANPVYLTVLSPDDEHYGEDGYYYGFCPANANFTATDKMDDVIREGLANHTLYADSIKWINMQIANWKTYLALNEQEKVQAYENREDKKKVAAYDNYSFDAGSRVSHSIEKESAHVTSWDETISAGLLLENEFGFKWNKFGFDIHLHNEATGGKHTVNENENDTIQSYSFELVEEGSDAITVDVYQYGAYGPIFRTRGGQTSNPYEGKVVTEYYKKGTTVMEATMQIEVPTIAVDAPVVNDIPSGTAANYTLRLGNESEIGEDVAYKLFVLDETNPDGAQLSIDGKVLTEGRLIKVPGNQALTKTLQLRQTNLSVLDYDSIAVVFASDSQPEDIYSMVYLSAHFTPSSSPVTLALSNRTMNTQTGGNMTLTISDFDRNYHNLKAFRLQYKQPGATDWTLLHEYVLDSNNASNENSELLPATGANVSYTKAMTSWPDGNYLFRVASVATYGNDEVYRYSDEVALVKDMQRPRPMGQPEPADGVLDIGDELSIQFNENILRGELSPELNFHVTGVLNGSEIAHETALLASGGSSSGTVAAQTEASINLANKDFSIDTWVNITSAGTLLSHGQGSNKLTVGTDADDKLVVTIAGNTYISTNNVPTGKWAFLTMNVTADGKLSATVATADETVSLFANQEVAAYAGNGPLSVGCGSMAAMHELLLWDEAHDLTTALMNRSKSKAPSTRHLIGYWKMNEGEGKEIRDYARNRNMVMPNETWYLNNENKAVTLDGGHYVSINAATLPTTAADDYVVEFWMRGNGQTAEAQLMQMGDVALWLNADGDLMLTGKGANVPDGNSLATTSGSLTDNAWHHIALNVLRQGAAAVYVDGKRCLTTNADNVGSIVTNKMIVGARRISNYEEGYSDPTYTYDRAFKGEVDEVRVWGATMNGDQIAKNRKVRFTGSEPGLIAYYPFETKKLDDYNQIVTIGTPNDLTGSGLTAQMVAFGGSPADAPAYTADAPALHTKAVEANVSFTYTASSDKIIINIDEDPATIEGCTLNFTVQSVRDENGNYSEPATWSAFVNRNELVWADDALSVEQQVKSESTVTAIIVNKGGKQQMWTLDGMPSWLNASADYGTTNPRSETTVTFTVSPATPIGKYEETVYLKGNDGIETPLTLNLKVTGKVPDWSVNPKDFENSMNVIGRVEIKGTPMDNEDDIVAAFIGEECRGVAHPVYKERYDGSFITMDIYGKDEKDENGNSIAQEVTFRAYDASTGTLYPVVTPNTDITFTPLALMGKYDEPVVFSVVDLIEQETDLKAGWNWLSLYVNTDKMTVDGIFEKIADDVITVKSQESWAMRNDNGEWKGSLTAMGNEQMYAVQLKADRKLRIVGQPVNPENCVITAESGWNWIGYYGRQVASVGYAIAGLQPVTGDILKGQSGVTYFDRYEWVGSLLMMEPGIGYMLKSNISNNRVFGYPAATVAAARSVHETATSVSGGLPAGAQLSVFTPINFRNYANNAIMAARLTANGKTIGNAALGVFAGNECRTAAVTNENGVVYLTIPGDDAATLTFKVAVGGKVYDAATTVGYEVDGVYGSPDSPVIIDLGEATGIVDVDVDVDVTDVYDLQGRKVDLKDGRRKLPKGVYIINGQKKTVK